jgi:phage shock protein A
MKIDRVLPRATPDGLALDVWALAMADAAAGEEALEVLRESVRVARIRSADRARRAYDALGAGQEPFARGLFDAAHAHEQLAREGEAQIAKGEWCCAALRARCDELDAAARRAGERQARHAGPGAGRVRSVYGFAR